MNERTNKQPRTLGRPDFHLSSDSCPGRARSFSGDRASAHYQSSCPSQAVLLGQNHASGLAQGEPKCLDKEGLPRGILGAPAFVNRGALSASANPTRTVCPFLRRPRVPRCLNHEFTCVHHENLRQRFLCFAGLSRFSRLRGAS
jgi:hypothetical protein